MVGFVDVFFFFRFWVLNFVANVSCISTSLAQLVRNGFPFFNDYLFSLQTKNKRTRKKLQYAKNTSGVKGGREALDLIALKIKCLLRAGRVMNLGEKLVRKVVVTGFSLDRNHRIIASDEVFI